jgi:hypothetical protein
MPTTNYLMFSDNTYSGIHKEKIRKKVLSDFAISLPTIDDENLDEYEARKRIVETMALIRKKLMKNKFLLQHNIEYGAMRNAIGGSVLGLLISLFNIVFFYLHDVHLAVVISTITLSIYILLILLSKVIINFYGNAYAKILFREYIGG